jgi:HK97 family phage major capsid protein
MTRKEKLTKKLNELRARKDELKKKALSSESADEVRSINKQLEELNDDITFFEDELRQLEEEGEPEKRHDVPPDGETRTVNDDMIGKTMGSYKTKDEEARNKDVFSSIEYRTAFKDYVQRGKEIPLELRAGGDNGVTWSEELGAIIPTTIMNEMIKEVQKVYGQLYSKVRKMSIKGGVKFPISNLKAEFKWISESTVSPRQKAGDIKDFIEFSYNIGEIRVAQTLLSSIVALDMFENEVVRIMTEAYLEAMDKGIMKGSGNGQMLGILSDPRVTNVLEFTDAEFSDWTKWRKKLFSEIPISKRGKGEFIFTASTVEGYLLTMQDGNGRPLFKEATELTVTDSSTGGRFFGREVTLVEPDVLTDMGIANAGDVVGVFWEPGQYAINSNMQFGIKRYFDDETNQWVNKGLTIVDGKILDPSGCYLIKKK